MDIRKIREDEREAFALLTRYAFSDWTEEEVPPERLAFARPENVWGVCVRTARILEEEGLRVYKLRRRVRAFKDEIDDWVKKRNDAKRNP